MAHAGTTAHSHWFVFQHQGPSTLTIQWTEDFTGASFTSASLSKTITIDGAVDFWYYDTAENSQTVPFGFDLLFPDEVAELEARGWRADFIAYIASESAADAAAAMERHAAPVGLQAETISLTESQTTNPMLYDLRRSDHDAFWQEGYPAIMISDTSEFRYEAYHCPGDLVDEVDNLNREFSTGVIKATVGAAVEILELR